MLKILLISLDNIIQFKTNSLTTYKWKQCSSKKTYIHFLDHNVQGLLHYNVYIFSSHNVIEQPMFAS